MDKFESLIVRIVDTFIKALSKAEPKISSKLDQVDDWLDSKST